MAGGPAAELAVWGRTGTPGRPECSSQGARDVSLRGALPVCRKQMGRGAVAWSGRGRWGFILRTPRETTPLGHERPPVPFLPPLCPPRVLSAAPRLTGVPIQTVARISSIRTSRPYGQSPCPLPHRGLGFRPLPRCPTAPGPRQPRQRWGWGLILRGQPSPSELVAAHLVSWTREGLFVVCLHLLFWQTLPKTDDSATELSVE